MSERNRFVGLDVSKQTIAAAIAEADGSVLKYGDVPNTPNAVRRLVETLSRGAMVKTAYEAGPTCYPLHRQLTTMGVENLVVAPSLIPRRPGDRVKTDQRDAVQLARLLRSGDLTPVWVPDEAHEALRDLVRARDDADIAEVIGLDRSRWPAGTRAICRREEPHPGAQLTFTDHHGYRCQVLVTNQTDADIASLEALHGSHARVEDRIRIAKQMGLENLPFREWGPNTVWLELVLMATDLMVWMQRVTLRGEAQSWEPKRLRHRLLHAAGRLSRSGRQLRLRLTRTWPWARELTAAFARLRALPAP